MVRVSAIVLLMYSFLRRHTNRVSLHSDEDWYILRVHAHDMPHVDVLELAITVHKIRMPFRDSRRCLEIVSYQLKQSVVKSADLSCGKVEQKAFAFYLKQVNIFIEFLMFHTRKKLGLLRPVICYCVAKI